MILLGVQVVPSPNGLYLVSTAEYKRVADVLTSMRKNHPNGNDGKALPLQNAANWQQLVARKGNEVRSADATEQWKCQMCGCYGEVEMDDTCPVCNAAREDAPEGPKTAPRLTPPGTRHSAPDIYIAPLDEQAFEDLDPRETFPEELPPHCRSAAGNRYWDILPNPITRVRLPVLRSDPQTEYVKQLDSGACAPMFGRVLHY